MPRRGRLVEPRAASVMGSAAIRGEDQHPRQRLQGTLVIRDSTRAAPTSSQRRPSARSDSLMFMTTDARVRSSWVTFEPLSASCSGQPHRQGGPSTGIGRRRRRIRRLHERIRLPTRKNNATNDFQHEIGISNSLSYSGTHATNVGKSGCLSSGPETYSPMIVGWCWKCMVG